MYFPLGLINKGNTLTTVRKSAKEYPEEKANLSKVKLSILLSCHTLNLYKRRVRASVAFCSFVTQNTAFAVQPA